MKLLAIHHVHLTMPSGQEDVARNFYGGLLGLAEVPKPPALAVRGGVWFGSDAIQLHLGVEDDFRPARKAHPAICVESLEQLGDDLVEAGCQVLYDEDLPGYKRFYVSDPFGNRLEFLEAIVSHERSRVLAQSSRRR